MLDQREQRYRRQFFSGGPRNAEQQGPGGCFRQRLAGAVVGRDVPARQQRGNPCSELPVRSHQRRRLARRLKRPAQRQCNRLRFGRRAGQLSKPDARQPPFCRLQRLPFVREFGGCHRIGYRTPTRRRGCPATRTAPRLHLASRDPKPVDQKLELELRMVGLRRDVLVGTERIPFLVGKDIRQPQPRQHHHPFRHPSDPSDKCRHRRRRCGDAGRYGEATRRFILPPLGKLAQQPVAPLG